MYFKLAVIKGRYLLSHFGQMARRLAKTLANIASTIRIFSAIFDRCRKKRKIENSKNKNPVYISAV